MLGVVGLSATYLAANRHTILNDAAYGMPPAPKGYTYVQVPNTPQYDGAFGGKLNYKELALGSVFGTIAGLVCGQLSSFFVAAGLGFYLVFQYLYSQGIVTVPFTKVIKIGSEYIDVKKMVFDKPSFNLTFISSFLIAAYNA